MKLFLSSLAALTISITTQANAAGPKLYFYPLNHPFEAVVDCEHFADAAAKGFTAVTHAPVLKSFCAKFATNSSYAIVLASKEKLATPFETLRAETMPTQYIPTVRTEVKKELTYAEAADEVQVKLKPYTYTVTEVLSKIVPDEATCLDLLSKFIEREYQGRVLFSYCKMDPNNTAQGYTFVMQLLAK